MKLANMKCRNIILNLTTGQEKDKKKKHQTRRKYHYLNNYSLFRVAMTGVLTVAG